MTAHYVPFLTTGGTWEFTTPLEDRSGFPTEAAARERAASVEAYDRMLADAAEKKLRKGKGPHARKLLAYFQSLEEVAS